MWNILGCVIFSSEVFAQEAMIESMTGEQKEWVRSTPRWVYVVFAISVSTGVAGSLCLLMRKKLSAPLFTISFAAVLIQMVYTMLIATIACSTVARVVWRFCVSPSIAKLANGRICKAASDLRLRRNTRPTGGDSVFHSYGGSGTSHDYIGSDCFNNFGPLYFCCWTTPITWSVTKRCSIESPAGAKLFVVN